MTIQELKRDIIRLQKAFIKARNSGDEYYNKIDELKKELKRLYYANENFEGMNAKHVLILLRINHSVRAIAVHHFGINIDIEKL